MSMEKLKQAICQSIDREKLKQTIFKNIDRKQAIDFLESLVRIPSEYAKPTYAQELVKLKLQEMHFELDCFPCEVEKIKDLPDFCTLPENLISPRDIYNIVAVKEGTKNEQAFLVHAHIDTSDRSEAMPNFEPYIEDGKIYGLGVADDKGGVAMMLMAAEAVLKTVPELKNRLIVMSTIGKRGAVGTLTAFLRGYQADAALYLHPAETGHGFREIKNYSMGQLDFNVKVTGKPGIFRDEIDNSEISAITKGAEVILAIQEWDRQRRETHRFQEDTFANLPNTKVNFLNAYSGGLLREDALEYTIQCRMCFGMEETVASVMEELRTFLHKYFKQDEWLSEHPLEITYGTMKATPACISRSSRLIQTLEDNIRQVQNPDNFIYQYHASSDIRMPNIYGNTKTVGIGPLCGGLSGDGEKEWMDLNDYIDGIKIIAGMIIDWCYQ